MTTLYSSCLLFFLSLKELKERFNTWYLSKEEEYNILVKSGRIRYKEKKERKIKRKINKKKKQKKERKEFFNQFQNS